MLRIHLYRGEVIRQCEAADGAHRGEWVILAESHGMLVADELLWHYQTLGEAKRSIREGGDGAS